MKSRNSQDFGLVYSTEEGRMCPACCKPIDACVCRRNETKTRDDGVVRVGRSTRDRNGKEMTLITGIPLDHDGLLILAKQLKQKCGAGGTMRDGVIEIQGDHRDMVVEDLGRRGYTVKRSGG
ncbi:MAG: translation initiation factor Sui1 [Deltaproteobacteria bacterium]|nr:translation initiation factor Sui1 [Deltaproteobacteria bacterium]